MEDNKSPLISIIIPVYNTRKEQLQRCIDSICMQTLRDIEIIIVDDGSDEKCRELLDNIALSDTRIKLIHKPNGGVSSARNAGIRKSTSKYIMFVDSDDWIDKECCREVSKKAEDKNVDILMWRYYKEYKDKSLEVKVYEDDYLEYNSWKKEFDPFDMRLMGMCWMKLYKRSLVKNNLFNEALTNGEDVEFNFRIYDKMHVAAYFNRAYYHYTQNDESAVRKFDTETLDKYSRTIVTLNKDICNSRRRTRQLKKAYNAFVGVSYLVINMNYIFTDSNKMSFKEKLDLLVKVSEMDIYSEVIEQAWNINLPITRRMSLIFAKYRLYIGIYAIMMVKHIINRLYSTKKRFG